MSTSSNTTANVIQSIAGSVGSAFVIYITVILRKGVKKFMGEHHWLMTQVGKNTAEILKSQEHIAELIDLQKARARPTATRRRT